VRAGSEEALTSGVDHLRAQDPVALALVERYGPPPRRIPVTPERRFEQLVQAIVHQQLAGRAAEAIHARLVTGLGGAVTPEVVAEVPPEILRSCGLSASKAAAVHGLADHVLSGAITLGRIGRLSDDEVIAQLTQVRGIGRWTAEMFLLGTLGRLDVWPVGDYGVRAGYAAAWGLPALPTPGQITVLGDQFRPYRSLLAWYCWRAADARRPVESHDPSDRSNRPGTPGRMALKPST